MCRQSNFIIWLKYKELVSKKRVNEKGFTKGKGRKKKGRRRHLADAKMSLWPIRITMPKSHS